MFEIGRVAYTRPHLLADTAEIAIAYGGYDQISSNDLLTIIKSTPRPDDELLPLEEEDVDDNNVEDGLDGAEINAQEQSYIDECMRQIRFRASSFGSMYPFVFDGDVLSLKKRISSDNRVYLFLLACARTRSFKIKGTPQRLADAFEKICAECLRRIVSSHGDVYMFGPNSSDRKKKFSSNLRKAIPILASKIGMRLKHGWERNYTSSGDGKIDLIGVYNFDNRALGLPVFLGQCASIEDEQQWQKKRLEAKFSSRSGSFDYLVEPQGILFIPGCYRQPDGDWVNSDLVSDVVTIDRLRLMAILKGYSGMRQLMDELYEKTEIKYAA
ncbi:hypothetical protein [Aminobacter sp. Piv2-1]|uniref:hypothetical protein n=1 Tax=Aminobacter sp. Piv2-1 TaxID=3031122 RepID=UPI0030B2EC5F